MKFSKNFHFGKIFKQCQLCRKFRKISIWVKFSYNFDFCHNNYESILLKIFENFEKSRFWFDFSKKFIFCRKFRKISIWVKFSKNFDLCQIFEKFRFGSNCRKNFDFGQNLRKFRINWRFRKISISVNFRKISILVKISEKFRFWSKFTKIPLFLKI